MWGSIRPPDDFGGLIEGGSHIERPLRINDRIRIAQIRVIAEDGSQLGVMVPADALKLAKEQGYDLVEVAPQANPPVCRIMDFNKFRYEQAKREREAKKKHHIAKLKETKFKPHINQHDYQTKLQQLKKFLLRGDKVKVTLVFRGREMAHIDVGRKVLERLRADLSGLIKIERDPMLEGRFMTMIITPDPAALKKIHRQQQASAQMTPQPQASGHHTQADSPTNTG